MEKAASFWGKSELKDILDHIDASKNALQSRYEELESREMEFEAKVRSFNSKMESKTEELRRTEGLIEGKRKEVDGKEKRLLLAENLQQELKMKRKQPSLIEKSVVECTNTLASKEKIIHAMEVKAKKFGFLKKRMESWSYELGKKKGVLEAWVEKLEYREKEVESKLSELYLIDKKVTKCLDEVELKEKCFGSLYKLVQERKNGLDAQEKLSQERSHGLEMKERKLEEQAKDLESKQKQFYLMVQGSSDQKSRELTHVHSEVETENMEVEVAAVPSSGGGNKSSINRGCTGKDLQFLMNENLKRIDIVGSEISAAIQVSSDPAKLVLDAMEGFYPSNSTVANAETEFDLMVVRRSCVLLLQQFKRFSLEINSQVREEAIKLAADWKAMMSGNWLEILGFLWLVSTYECTTAYDAKELQDLVAIVAEQEQATELCQAFGITNKAPKTSNIDFPIKIEELESSAVKNAAASSSPPNVQVSATKCVENLQGSMKASLSVNQSMQDKRFQALQVSLAPRTLALKLLESSLHKCWDKRDVGIEATAMEDNISLLSDLTKALQQVGPGAKENVKDNALKLADKWKGKMKADTRNSVEVVSFLQFLTTYDLLSTLEGDEIVKFVGMISLHKQASDLCQKLGFADKIPGFCKYYDKPRCPERGKRSSTNGFPFVFEPKQIRSKRYKQLSELP